jgi:hypothetical protein
MIIVQDDHQNGGKFTVAAVSIGEAALSATEVSIKS